MREKSPLDLGSRNGVRFSAFYVGLPPTPGVIWPARVGPVLTRSGHAGSHNLELFQLVQQRLRVLQIGAVEALGEPAEGALGLAAFLCGDGGWLQGPRLMVRLDPGRELVWWYRPAKQIALRFVATEVTQGSELLIGFHAFSDYF